jgi:hypothetical protein
MAGYSGTPLAQKLGVKPGARLVVLGGPAALLPDDVPVRRRLGPGDGTADVVVAFFTSRRRLEARLPALERAIFPAGGLWLAWPKKASGVATDLTEDVLREVGLPRGLVDNKVCAVDDTWSGLRFVWRKDRRP